MTVRASASYQGTLHDLWTESDAVEVTAMMASVARWLEGSNSTKRVRQARGLLAASDPGDWQGMAALGLAGICIPQGDGGLGMSPAVGALAAEVIGRHLTPEPFLACAFLPSIYFGALPRSVLVQRLMGGIADGTMRPVIAAEGQFPGDIGPEDNLSATTSDGGLVLKGIRRFVCAADWATHFIVPLAGPDGPLVLAIASTHPGLSVDLFELCDGSHAGNLHFDGAVVAADAIVASGDVLAAASERFQIWTKLGVAAELMGVQSALFGVTIEYIKTRRQFGRELAGFQALQHRAVDLYSHKEVARHLIADTLNEAHSRPCADAILPLALRCKARVASSGQCIAREAVQMHGAIGFSDECDVSLYLNRTLILNAWGGGADANRRKLAAARLES